MTHDFKVIIPARYGSTRLPGKPLCDLAGQPMIQRVVECARASAASAVIVATDDQRILDVCAHLNIDAELTAATHRNGSDRIAEVITRRGWSDETLVINVQGDEPLLPASLINQVAANLATRAHLGMATLAYPITDSASLFDPNCVKVVFNHAGEALYFSRAPIPWQRDEFAAHPHQLPASITYWRHIGIYAYRVAALKQFVNLEPAPLELAESLEQLRALWHGMAIHVECALEAPGPGVDTAEDLMRVLEHLERLNAAV